MTRGRPLRTLGITVLALVVAVALVLGVAAVSLATRPLPDTSGTVEVPGLSTKVTVRRDASGVPHLSGTDLADLVRAQGYVHAQDRFFDMDLRRHIATGTLSTLVGEAGLAVDRVVRTLGWRQVAEASLPLLEPDTRRYLQAYADGVNDYTRSRSANRLGLEYLVLGLRGPAHVIEAWTPVDSLAWLTAMAWDLRGNYDDELARARLTGRVDPLALLQLYPGSDPQEHAPILGPADWQPGRQPPPPTAPAGHTPPTDPGPGEWYAAIAAELDRVPALYGRGDGVGSNAWVVAGQHTATGRPLLANDPHLGPRVPGVWYQNSLTCEALTDACPLAVSGFSFPGLPGVVIGHNDRIAWALTNLGADVTDFRLERIDLSGRVLRDGEWVEMTTRREVIEVAGGATEVLTVRSTDHGPLVSDVIAAAADAGAHAPVFAAGEDGHVHGLSLTWTGLEPGKTADAILGLNRARDVHEFRTALADFAVPAQSVLYADVDGHIGYQALGAIPVRRAVEDGQVPGFWPAPGWDSAFDWTGRVPFEDLPWTLDPPSGVIVAANQQVSGSVTPFLTSEWDPGFRSTRIGELLARADGPLDARDLADIQVDTVDPFASTLVAALISVDLSTDPFTAQARDLLVGWDHTTPARGPGSAPAAYFNAVWRHLLSLTFDDELPADLAPDGGARYRVVMETLLADATNPWWDDIDTEEVTEGRAEILRQAMVSAAVDLTKALGKDPRSWQWGELHTWTPTHPVLGGPDVPAPIRRIFNADPVPLGGGSAIVNANGWDAARGYAVDWAPSMRMVVDLADLDASLWINQTGVSGHRASEHHTDQLADWAAGRMRPWPFGKQSVEAATKDVLVLRPGP